MWLPVSVGANTIRGLAVVGVLTNQLVLLFPIAIRFKMHPLKQQYNFNHFNDKPGYII